MTPRQGRPAVQAPILGAGRSNLRRHHLHRPAQRLDRLSQRGFLQFRKRRGAGRLCLRSHRVRVRGAAARRAGGGNLSSTEPISTRNTSRSSTMAWRWLGTVCLGPWAVPATGARISARGIMTISRHGRADRAGGRARLAHPSLAGRCNPLGPRHHPSCSPTRYGGLSP